MTKTISPNYIFHSAEWFWPLVVGIPAVVLLICWRFYCAKFSFRWRLAVGALVACVITPYFHFNYEGNPAGTADVFPAVAGPLHGEITGSFNILLTALLLLTGWSGVRFARSGLIPLVRSATLARARNSSCLKKCGYCGQDNVGGAAECGWCGMTMASEAKMI